MVISWEAIAFGTVLTIVVALALLQLPVVRREVALKHTFGLALAGGAGLLIWNIFLNTFSLSGLDLDAPVIRVSVADIMSGVLALLLAWLYGQAAKARATSKNGPSAGLISLDSLQSGIIPKVRESFGLWSYLLPALAAFIVDLFFV